MNKVKDFIKNHINYYSFFTKIKNRKNNIYVNNIIKNVSDIDSITNYTEFRKKISDIIDSKKLIQIYAYGADSYFYGYYDQLLRYSGYSNKGYTLLPGIEHGIRFDDQKWRYYDNYVAYASQGKYRISDIHKINSNRMVFSLGPYIHYSEKYYDELKEKQLKQKLGKVVLVFPSHTNEEETDIGTKTNFVDLIMKKYSKQFDTIMICTYWRDINTPIIRDFEKKGAMIVSAGFRGDTNFIKRLKTIISLSDLVVGDDIGTNIGFVLYMKKNFILENNIPRYNNPLFIHNFNLFYTAFHTDNNTFTDKQLALQKQLYNKFWGGDEELKSVSEMNCILNVINDILKKCHYNIKNYDKVLYSKLNEYKTNNEKIKYYILKNAIESIN